MPTGGKKDISPPRLLSSNPLNKTKNFNNKNIELYFDENIAENKWSENFNISPLTENPIGYKIRKNTLTLETKDNLKKNTTYCINLNNCIKDLNEGNILKELRVSFSTGDNFDSLSVQGVVFDAFTLDPKANVHVFLQEKSLNDSLCFKRKPKYATRTNSEGKFIISNLNDDDYKIFCIDGLDYEYHDGDLLGFYSSTINANDSNNIELLIYDPKFKEEALSDTIPADSLTQNETQIEINCEFKEDIILQLYSGKTMVKQSIFNEPPYILKNIKSQSYSLKIIIDENKNGNWDVGNYNEKRQPEKIYIYKEKIDVRDNWTFEIDCFID